MFERRDGCASIEGKPTKIGLQRSFIVPVVVHSKPKDGNGRTETKNDVPIITGQRKLESMCATVLREARRHKKMICPMLSV